MQPTTTASISRVLHRLSTASSVERQRKAFLSRFGTILFAVIAVLLLAFIGWWTRYEVQQTIETQLTDDLVQILDSNVAALNYWLQGREASAKFMASEPRVENFVINLNQEAVTNGGKREALLASPHLRELRALLSEMESAWEYDGFLVVNGSGICIGSSDDDWVGDRSLIRKLGIGDTALKGEATVSHPKFVDLDLDPNGNRIWMFVEAPVRAANGEVVAALCFWLDPEAGFANVLQQTRAGKTGETYAFNSNGVVISQSRFDDELKKLKLIPDDPDSTSTLNLDLRNPGGNMLKGYRPTIARKAQPLTDMAAHAVSGESGSNVVGAPDYRGVPAVSAWTWIPKYQFGVATKMDYDEAYASLNPVRYSFYTLIAILAVVMAGLIGATQAATSMRQRAREAELKANKLGQYTLGEKLGEGGMGEVYKATHAMLRRPTAIKLLRAQDSDQAVQRFEREVQITSQLTHPNTISIFDYGRTENGTFYYVMEYLAGLSLDRLVMQAGPLPEGRTIHLLRQICESLREAHLQGLIHRDIKPANIMICQRGGIYDFVKVLDFGLVKDVSSSQNVKLTAASTVTGTPQYLSPEAIQHPDHTDSRSDIYAVGAVGYFMLTGTPVFEGNKPLEVLQKHLTDPVELPSQRVKHPIASDIEQIIVRCLDKSREKRPYIDELLAELNSCKDAHTWGNEEADHWWNSQVGIMLPAASPPTDTGTTDRTLPMDINGGS
ncbi:serine/threonine protein kinase [bacterium]|nr:serine/threonine protein kinase [bacterium]